MSDLPDAADLLSPTDTVRTRTLNEDVGVDEVPEDDPTRRMPLPDFAKSCRVRGFSDPLRCDHARSRYSAA